MKRLILILFLLLSACKGTDDSGGGSSTAPITGPGGSLIIEFTSLNIWRSTGVDDVPFTIDVEEVLTIPSIITVTEDSDSDLVFNDIATVTFVNDECTYLYDGSRFLFQSCGGDLLGFRDGDHLTLESIEESIAPTLNDKVKIGLQRSSINLHTGFITIETELN